MAKIENATVRGREKTTTPVPSQPATLTITKPGVSRFPTIVLFGPPKTGKTVTAVSGTGRKLLILTEPDGDLPLVGRDDIDVVKPTTGKEIYDVVQALHAGAHEPYDRIVLDSVTFAFEVMGRQQISKALADGVDVRRPYGQVGAAVTQILHDLIALPVDKVITAQLKNEFVDDEDPDAAGPEEGKYPHTLAVTPMVSKVLTPAASALGRTYKQMYIDARGNKVVRYLVSFEDYGKSPAGSRAALTGPVENLDMTELIDTLKGGSK